MENCPGRTSGLDTASLMASLPEAARRYLAERFGQGAKIDLHTEFAGLQNAVDGMGLRNHPDIR